MCAAGLGQAWAAVRGDQAGTRDREGQYERQGVAVVGVHRAGDLYS